MHRRRLLAAAGAIPIALLTSPAGACLWDEDTMAAEAAGLPEVVDVLTGRFPRNPPLYDEQRLVRVAAKVAAGARDLDLYDDAGVASDRIGQGNDAVAWMELKRAELDRRDPDAAATRDHRYRYLANLGTFFAHRWLRNGGRRDDLRDLRDARGRIAAAIQLNPAAHFGRERYQLLAIEAMLDGVGGAPGNEAATFLERPDWDDRRRERMRRPRANRDEGALRELGYPDAVKGLSGLVVLGNAWESVDVFYALALALQHEGRSTLAYLAWKRMAELFAQGRRSLVTQGPDADDARARSTPGYALTNRTADLDAYFTAARQAAERWQARREAFMLARLRKGQHPDTDATFWQGFDGGDAPPLPGSTIRDHAVEAARDPRTYLGGFALVGGLLVFGVARDAIRKARRRAPRS